MDRKTVVCRVDIVALQRAAHIIATGGVVAFPTDTVYGLGCDLFNPQAVARIFDIKGRARRMPLIAMFALPSQCVLVAATLPESASMLMKRWWPGPLTIIAPALPVVPELVLGGGSTIGMRIPDHPAALAMLSLLPCPLATTSANISGEPSATTAEEVAAQLDGQLDLILDGGACARGQASTVLDCSTDPPTIVRLGPLSGADLGLSGIFQGRST